MKTDKTGQLETQIENLRLGFDYKVTIEAKADKYYPQTFSEGTLGLNNHYMTGNLAVRLAEKNVSGVVSGFVQNNRTGEPIRDAEIELVINHELRKAKTDSKGHFEIHQDNFHPWDAYKGSFKVKKVGYHAFGQGKVLLIAANEFKSTGVHVILGEHNTTGSFGGQILNERDGTPSRNAKI